MSASALGIVTPWGRDCGLGFRRRAASEAMTAAPKI